jgi:Na+/H+-dicarboxylate symporters
MLRAWQSISLFNRIMLGFILGIALGLVLGPSASHLNFLGTILVRLLTMVVAPLVLCLLICAAADVGDYRALGKIGIQTVIIFMASTCVAVALGLVTANLFSVGTGVNLDITQTAVQPNVSVPSALDTLINIIPSNPFQAMSTGNLLQIIFFALFFGFALTKLGDKGKTVLDFFRGTSTVMGEITSMVLEFTPFGVLGLMANVVGINGVTILLPYAKAIAATYICCFFVVLVLQAVIMAGVFGKISPIRFLKELKEPALFIFATCSSVATIPLTLEGTKRLGVSEKVANFVIPFGAVMNMNGTAVYEAVAIIFTAQIYGIDLSVMEQCIVLLSATLASVGTAGVPGSGLVMLTIVLASVNLPMEAIGLLAGIDRILNMARVIPNILGDAAASVIVARWNGEMNDAVARKGA